MKSKKYSYGSVRTAEGTVAFYLDRKDGKNPVMHRTDGPALIRDGDWEKREYYINGLKISEEQFNEYNNSFKGTSTVNIYES